MASAIFAAGAVALLPVLSGAVIATREARDRSAASRLAAQKLEALRGEALAPSPPSALLVDTPGFVDYVDQSGTVVAAGGSYVRRWSVVAGPGALTRVAVRVSPVSRPAWGLVLASARRVRP